MAREKKSATEIREELMKMILGENKGNRVIYVCQDDNKLPADEEELLSEYRKLDQFRQGKLIGMMKGANL